MKCQHNVCSFLQSKELNQRGIARRKNGFFWVDTSPAVKSMWDHDRNLVAKHAQQMELSDASTLEEYLQRWANQYLYFRHGHHSTGVHNPHGHYLSGDHYTALTGHDILSVLPEEINRHFEFPGYEVPEEGSYSLKLNRWLFDTDSGRSYGCRYDYNGNINIATETFVFESEAEALCQLLINLIDDKVLSVEDLNEKLAL